MLKKVLLTLVAAAALALCGSAVADQVYVDSTGEAPGSADISSVSVANDASAGTYTFVVRTNLPALDPTTYLGIVIDADQNPATGTAGFDFAIGGYSTGSIVSNTTTHRIVPVAAWSFDGGVWTVTVRAADIGNTQAFSFFALTDEGPNPAAHDRAPDSGLWSYPPPPPPPPPAPTVASFAASYTGVPTHGKVFRIRGLAVALSDGTATTATGVACAAKLAGKRLAGTGPGGCTLRLPKTAKRKRLVVAINGAYTVTPLVRTYAFVVR